MRRFLAAILLILAVGCRSGTGTPIPEASSPGVGYTPPATPPSGLELQLNATAEQDSWRITLSAPSATDLYQLAGTLIYEPERYTLRSVEAGGGLGGPQDAYFVWGEHDHGRLDFAYTKRYYGAGFSGQVSLLSIRVNALDGFRLADFRLDTSTGKLLARDSAKRGFAVQLAGEVQ